MFKIFDSNVKITKIKEISPKMVVGTLYTTYKREDNQFIKTFVECKIVGNALVEFKKLGIKDKQKFNIIEGNLKNEPYLKDGQDRSKMVITIFDLKAYEEK